MVSAHETRSSRSLSFQFIINPSAGQGKYKRIVYAIHRILSGSGLQYEIEVPQYGDEATSIAKKAADGYDVVVAVGGDGTINRVLNGIIGSQAILGIIPAGTGNGFARELGLPLRPEEACEVLVEGRMKWIDVGRANGKYFLGTAGIGFDALIAKVAGERLGLLRGMWLYFFAGALMFYRFTPQLLSVGIDSEVIEVSPLVVAIANTRRYGGRALIAPNAKPDDGLLDVCVIQNMSAARLLRHLPKLFTGQHIRLSEVAVYRGRSIAIDAPKPIPVHIDGEAIDSRNRVRFTLLPRAIRVLVPEDCVS
jgi:YegS/Rv2252/BmrU family lipid kinase